MNDERYQDFGSLCHCGMKLLGDMEKDVWVCEGCKLEEELCECEPENA